MYSSTTKRQTCLQTRQFFTTDDKPIYFTRQQCHMSVCHMVNLSAQARVHESRMLTKRTFEITRCVRPSVLLYVKFCFKVLLLYSIIPIQSKLVCDSLPKLQKCHKNNVENSSSITSFIGPDLT